MPNPIQDAHCSYRRKGRGNSQPLRVVRYARVVAEVHPLRWGLLHINVPTLATLNPAVLVLAAVAFIAMLRFKVGVSATLAGCAMLGLLTSTTTAHAAAACTLTIEARIPLGNVSGRIDHLALDTVRQHLYVAELGNNSVGVIDLQARKLLRTLSGFKEPQGIAYEPSTDAIYVANAADGSVRVLNAADFTSLATIMLGDDADNVRVDTANTRVYVGYGDGALAVINPRRHLKIEDIPLKGHPESFQLERSNPRIFVNVPDTHVIAVIDRTRNRQIQSWPTHNLSANFPLALDEAQHRVLAVFRHPATLAVFNADDGSLLSTTTTCGDSDDVFVDTKRQRAYVSCGEGFIETFQSSGNGYARVDRLATSPGARTALYMPELDLLFLAVRSTQTASAAVWVLRPSN